jgi:hypothetical protein
METCELAMILKGQLGPNWSLPSILIIFSVAILEIAPFWLGLSHLDDRVSLVGLRISLKMQNLSCHQHKKNNSSQRLD